MDSGNYFGVDSFMYRGTFAIVDKTAVTANVAAIRAFLGLGTKLLVAVKSDGYGHGLVPIAQAFLAGGAHYLGVATLEEALQLRSAGVHAPVLVLGAVSAEAAKAAAHGNIEITVTEDWSRQVPSGFSHPLGVHLKFDTGMNRLGFRSPTELVSAAQSFQKCPNVNIAGVFTHLACADAESLHHAQRQLQRFDEALEALRSAGFAPIAHAANSAAALRMPQSHYGMVRVGISAYGFPPADGVPLPVQLRQAMNLYSFITRIAEVADGETVGYGATYTASGTRRIATVPVGYGDGYPRHLSNRGSVLVGRQRVPVVGNVCMDQLMIDVTDVPGASVGDCVTVYGQAAPDEWKFAAIEKMDEEHQIQYLLGTFRQSRSSRSLSQSVPSISIADMAAQAGTISYELICAVDNRVPRFYLD